MSTQQPFILGVVLPTWYDAAISLFAIAAKPQSGEMPGPYILIHDWSIPL